MYQKEIFYLNKTTVSRNQMGTVTAEMSSWTGHTGMKKAFETKNMKSYNLESFVEDINI